VIRFAEYLSSEPDEFSIHLRQLGVRDVVIEMPTGQPNGEPPWSEKSLQRAVDAYAERGLRVEAIEEDNSPPLHRTRLGADGRDEEIDVYCSLIENMGKVGIPVLCYNWMAVIGVQRTSLAVKGRGGALVTAFERDHESMLEPTEAGHIPSEQLWDSLEYFLDRVVPVAEQSGVRLAMHPDDPPLPSIRGIDRIMSNLENFQRLIDINDSSSNSIAFCQGNFTLMTDDVPKAIRHFGNQDRIAFGHFRDVDGDVENFVETFHDEGKSDMLACMQAWEDIPFAGVLRPDHVPTLAGESNDQPMYARLARLFALGYMVGLRESTTTTSSD
jgi:mannonate dehydratase